jgi:hypothetical protein
VCREPTIPGKVSRVSGRQRIFVVSTAASEADVIRLREDLGRDPVVIAAPTADAKRVVRTLRVDPQVEVLLAPVSFPGADRGHRLDTLVRGHALQDRFRDVVVVTDTATSTLLLRVIAPDQMSSRGAVTTVGLPRGGRLVSARRAIAVGFVLGVLAGLMEPLTPVVTLPVAAAVVGLGLLLVPPWRHLGRELLLASGIALAVVLGLAAGSARFPGGT